MYPPDERDALKDALALINASHYRDVEAMAAIMKYGDQEQICLNLAKIAADQLLDLVAWWEQFLPGWNEAPMQALLARQREGWLSDDDA